MVIKLFQRSRLAALAAVLGSIFTAQIVHAQTCAIDPTRGGGGMEATSRFGVWRQRYNGGAGGGHGGQDLRAKVGTQLYSPFDGTVLYKSVQDPGAGNFLAIRNSNGDVAWLMHLSGYANGIAIGSKVTAGQFIGLSGQSGANNNPHLHFEYTVKKSDDARNKVLTQGFSREQVFQASSKLAKKSDGTYTTDPAGYLCDSYTFVKEAMADNAKFGKTTKEQYAILYGSVPNGTPPNSTYTPAQTISANSVAILANAEGKTVTSFLSNRDGYGTLPGVRYESYEKFSPSEMLSKESKRRMIDAEWQKNLTFVSSRALWVDYLQTIAISNYMNESIYRKREKVEGLLATLVAQNALGQSQSADLTRDNAVKQSAIAKLR